MKKILLTVAAIALVASAPLTTKKVKKVTPKVVAPLVMKNAIPSGVVPPGMPAILSVGLFEDTGQTWMKTSAIPWTYRYRYLTYRWSSNWGFGPRDGSFAREFMTDSDTQGFKPVIEYYELWDLPPSGTGTLAKVQNPSAMAEYFNDFKLLMQQAKTFGKPVVVLVEADTTGYLQGDAITSAAAAAVASTGLPELQGLPNTVAGWGLAFLQMRKAVGASNVILGMHVSGWATGQDIFHFSTDTDLQTAVNSAYTFLAPLGLVPNITGSTYDLLVGDPLDRDADFYRVTTGEDRWWDSSDLAGLNTKSFNRYAEWLRLWNVKSGLRWVLWQIPIGNSSSKNVCNTGGANQGYKDNRTEYFFGAGSAIHRQMFADNGVISLLFGQGEDCQASYQSDYDAFGRLYLMTQAGAYLRAGGLPLVTPPVFDAGTPVIDAGTPVVDSGVVDAGTPVVDAGTATVAQYNFENGFQGFATVGKVMLQSLVTTKAFEGTHSLAVTFTGVAGTQQTAVANAAVPAGKTVTFHVFIPAGQMLKSVQAFAQESQSTGWRWNADWKDATTLTVNAWNTFTVKVPTNASAIQSLGVEFASKAGFKGTVYVDGISWGAVVPPPTDAGAPAVDSGTVVDAGAPVIDAGTPVVDAGQPVDSGSLLDAGSLGFIRLMPLGDSITAEEWSWRCALFNDIVGSGRQTTFVGSVHNGYDPCAPDHEGHPGWTIDNLLVPLQGLLLTYRPDVVVLMAGSNDLLWWTTETGTQIADRLNAMVTVIQNQLPGVRIVVQTVPPTTSSIIAPNNVNRQVLVQQYNTRLRSLIANRVSAGQRVRLADINAVLTVADLRDGVHPTAEAGINKMTPVIWAALQQLIP